MKVEGPASFPGSEAFTLERHALFPALVEARVHKTPGEIALMRYVNKIGSEAHVAMMQVGMGRVPQSGGCIEVRDGQRCEGVGVGYVGVLGVYVP